MKVISAEFISQKGSRGVFVEFLSVDNVKKDSYFRITVDKKVYNFEVVGIKVDLDVLKITAKEVGYWSSKLDNKDIDLRTIIGCEVIPVTDEETIKNIRTSSEYC